MNTDRKNRLLVTGRDALASALLAGWVVAGCSGPADGQVETIGYAGQALGPQEGYCVLAPSGPLLVGDRSLVQGLTGGRTLDVGVDARINGTLFVDGSGVLRDRARVTGDVSLGGFLSIGNGAVVTGFVRQRFPVTLPRLRSQAIPAGEDPVSIGPGANTTLPSGGYGDVIIRSRSTVRLFGTYDVTSFTVEPDVTLIEDPPGIGIQINSVGSLTLGDRSVLRAADPVAVPIYSGGPVVSIGSQASITGIIDAPIATISLGSRSRLNGCAGGAEINVAPDAVIASTNPSAALPMQPQP